MRFFYLIPSQKELYKELYRIPTVSKSDDAFTSLNDN